MSRHMREQVRWGFVAGLAGAATWAAVVGCSSSNGPDGGSVGCDPAQSTCLDVGEACDSNLQCGSGSCMGGECASAEGVGGSSNMETGTGGTFGFVDDLDPQGGSGGEEASCVDLDVDFTRVTPTVVLLIDQSGSMLQNFDNGVNRWRTLRNTLTNPQTSLLKKLETSVRFGMSLYTSNRGYGEPSAPDYPRECPLLETVDIALGSFSDMSEMLEDNGPSGDTPTAESVEQIVERLAAFDEEGPKSIILATDGDPDTCEDPDANDDGGSKGRSVAAVNAAYAEGITTHVISVGNQVTASHLKDLAVAGAGGDEDVEAYTALNTTALEDAFNQIIGSVRTCDFTLQGRVELDEAARGTVTVDGQVLTFGDPNGWEMPDDTTVRLLGEACEAVQADAAGVSMRFPCDAIEIIVQ